jgi:hypothetical protein
MYYCKCNIFSKKNIFFSFVLLELCLLFFSVQAQGKKEIDSLQNLLKNAKKESLNEIYLALSEQYTSLKPDSALYYNLKAKAVAIKSRNRKQVAEVNKRLIYDYMSVGKFAEAQEASDSALLAYQLLKDEINQAEVYDRTAYIFAVTGKVSRQYDYIFRAIELYEENENEEGMAYVYSHLGIAFTADQQYIKALPYLYRSLALMEKLKKDDGVAMAATNIGYLYEQQTKYDSAEIYLRKGLRAGFRAEDWLNILSALENLAEIHIERQNYKAASDTLLFALKKVEEMNMTYHTTPILLGLARVNFYQKNYMQGIENAEKLLAIAQKTKDRSYEASAYDILSSIYQETNQPDSAIKFLRLYNAFSDSLWREGNHEEVTDLTIKYSTNQKEKENILLKLNLERQKRTQYVWISSLSFCLLLAIMLGYGYWQRSKNLKAQKVLADQERLIFEKENIILLQEQEQQAIRAKALEYEIAAQQEINRLEQEKLQESIDSKSRALASLAVSIVQKNAILQELKEKISENWKSKASLESKIKNLLSDIDNNMDLEEEWNNFKQHFEQVHPNFFVKLNQICADLTPHEVRFCTYIKMNLSAKDIAQMMNVTNRAIQMNRHRIKKKMNIDEGVDFTNFIRMI